MPLLASLHAYGSHNFSKMGAYSSLLFKGDGIGVMRITNETCTYHLNTKFNCTFATNLNERSLIKKQQRTTRLSPKLQRWFFGFWYMHLVRSAGCCFQDVHVCIVPPPYSAPTTQSYAEMSYASVLHIWLHSALNQTTAYLSQRKLPADLKCSYISLKPLKM